jgi:hypothetical protein
MRVLLEHRGVATGAIQGGTVMACVDLEYEAVPMMHRE